MLPSIHPILLAPCFRSCSFSEHSYKTSSKQKKSPFLDELNQYGSLGSSLSLLSLPCLMIQCETSFIKIFFLLFRSNFSTLSILSFRDVTSLRIALLKTRHSLPEPYITKEGRERSKASRMRWNHAS